LDDKRALDYAYLFLVRSYERDLLWSVVRSLQRKVMELKLGADLNEIECPHHSRSYIICAKCCISSSVCCQA